MSNSRRTRLSNNLVTKILGFGFVMFVLAILVIALTLPFGDDVKTKSMNSEVIGILVNPISAIIGALLRGMSSEK